MKEENAIECLLEGLCGEQEARLAQYAQEMGILCTEEDLLQPMDFPTLEWDPIFRYQEGVLSGLRMALVACRRERLCKQPFLEGSRNTICDDHTGQVSDQ